MLIKANSETVRLLLQAASDGEIKVLEKATDDDLSNARCSSGCTALHWAAGNDQISMIRYLVEQRKILVNIKATKNAKDRTPLHYAARNGCLAAARLLVELGALVDARAKHGVSPFQLAVWQNNLDVCRYLVEEQGVDAAQLNVFDCGAVHWIGLCPCAGADGPLCEGELLLPMARWLASRADIDFTIRQRQGHSALHKAAWGGHIALIRWLRDEIGLLDDSQDEAGNYAADLADMAHDDRHKRVAEFLRRECSSARLKSCEILGIAIHSSPDEIRQAYLSKAKLVHPDRLHEDDAWSHDFNEIHKAYEHLTKDDGAGKQANPAHSLTLMLELSGASSTEEKILDEEDFFKARLISVLLEYGEKGLALSNIGRKWTQVWPDTPYPWEQSASEKSGNQKKKGVILDYIRKHAMDIVDIVPPVDGTGQTLIVPKRLTQSQIAAAAATAK